MIVNKNCLSISVMYFILSGRRHIVVELLLIFAYKNQTCITLKYCVLYLKYFELFGGRFRYDEHDL